MLKILKAHGVDVYTMSNGTLVSDDLARRLVEAGLDELVVSMDAAEPETYAGIRPPGKLEDLLAGLRSIRDWKQRLGVAHPRVDIGFVGMRSNIRELPAVVRLAAELDVTQVCLQAMGEYPGLENESVAAHDKPLGRAVYAEARQEGERIGVAVVLMPEDQFEQDRTDHNHLRDACDFRKHCADLWNRAVIAATGEVLPCCASPRPLGSLREQSFEAIWRGKAYNDLRRQFLSDNLPHMCRHCTGMGRTPDSIRGDLDFFFGSLVGPRVKRRLRRRLKQVPVARAAKRAADCLRHR